MMLTSGIEEDKLSEHYDDKTIDAALGQRGFGLHRLMHETIQAAGMSAAPGMATDKFIRTAFEADRKLRDMQIQATGVSNYGLTSTIGNIANKFVV